MNGQQLAEPTPSSRFSSSHQPSTRRAAPKGPQGAPKMAVHCPHCEDLASLRTSKVLTPIFKELRFQCLNVECGHTFVASLEIVRTICPSARPNPKVKLRMAPPRHHEPANDVLPAAVPGPAA